MPRHPATGSTLGCGVIFAALAFPACGKGGPAPGADLGGIDFQKYCDATGGGKAVIDGDWFCDKDGTKRRADANAACRTSYPDVKSHSEVAKQGDPLSYKCYAAIEGELGGLNLDVYCASIGAKSSFVDAATSKWHCARDGAPPVVVDLDAACSVAYVNPAAKSKMLRPGNLTSIVCVRP